MLDYSTSVNLRRTTASGDWAGTPPALVLLRWQDIEARVTRTSEPTEEGVQYILDTFSSPKHCRVHSKLPLPDVY
jgi:hypothetical protein